MKLLIASDIHYEFIKSHKGKKEHKKPLNNRDDKNIYELIDDHAVNNDVDYIVFAGDIDTYRRGFSFRKPLIFVPGNHDYYSKKINKRDEDWSKFEKETNWITLYNGKKFVDNGEFRIIGSTLWTDYIDKSLTHKMNDFTCIKSSNHPYKFTSQMWLQYHINESNELKKRIQEAELLNKRVICVTHYVPSYNCIHSKYKNDDINCFYASRNIEFIHKPELWIFGHTHMPADFTENNTRFFSNPHGYPGEDFNFDFINRSIIEIT